MNRLLIGICDDEKIIINQLKKMISELLDDKQVEYEIQTFISGEALLLHIKNLDLVFLDIEMPNMDGIETGKMIEKENPNCKIIMATGRVDRFKESFYINAMRFVTKPFDKLEINEAIETFLKKNIGTSKIDLYFNRNKYSINQREIKYIKAYNGYVECKVKDKFFRKDISLSNIQLELDMRMFIEVNNSYCINMFWIEGYEKSGIIVDGEKIQVSRRKKKDFEKEWMYFDLNYR